MSLAASGPTPQPHRTPLRRVSQSSLFRLSRSGAHSSDAPHDLAFLEPALAELVDEAEALQANVDGLRALGDALGTFNESFASWLYVMNMHSLTTEWPQAPTDTSFALAAHRADADARAAIAALQLAQEEAATAAAAAAQARPPTPDADTTDTTYTANTTLTAPSSKGAGTSATAPKKKGKPKMSARERKERGLAVDRVVAALPLEFRGNDPNLRRHIETVIEGFMDREGRGVGILELVKPPDLNQARVNKCLIALVNRKIVRKDNSTGSVLYHWQGLPG